MSRNKKHFLLRELGKPQEFRASGGRGKRPSDVLNREAHADAILRALDFLPDIRTENLPGIYLEFSSRPNEALKREALDASGLQLLKVIDSSQSELGQETAVVYASSGGIDKLRTKVEDFRTKDNPDKERNGRLIPGRPKHADLVQSINAITEAGLRALWRSPAQQFPLHTDPTSWEIWLNRTDAESFIEKSRELGLVFGSERLDFPEDVVVLASCGRNDLANAIRRVKGVKAIAAPTATAEFFIGLDPIEQTEWVNELLGRTSYPEGVGSGYVTLFDTGVSRSHPLIRPSLAVEDRHAALLEWGVEDLHGHGTALAGLSLFGDLNAVLATSGPIHVLNRLESVKLIPDAGENPHHLYGAVTRNAVDVVEQAAVRRRTFSVAITTHLDTPHDGAPTSWSSEIDQLTAGVSGLSKTQRLFLISAGNTIGGNFESDDYLDDCDHEDHELESPAQAWNSLAIGAYTEKSVVPQNASGTPMAPFGDLSPSSRTASWTRIWPIKPDVVLEGGNWLKIENSPPLNHPALSLLSFAHNYPKASFDLVQDTSAATALAAKQITELWTEYPDLWPETVRGLYVSSARWTQQMKSHLPKPTLKSHYAPLFKRYGYGVPDMLRATRSASNALTLIVEDKITPYGISSSGSPIQNQMKVFELPWPVEKLRELQNIQVTLRVTLSTFIAPNPAEALRGTKYNYASHNLRFKLKHANDTVEEFLSRVSKSTEQPNETGQKEDDGWEFGTNRRDVGSLQIDQLTCAASDLARRNLIAVHPIAGWWKSKSILQEKVPTARYALIVEIDVGSADVDLYTEVEAAVRALVETQNTITV